MKIVDSPEKERVHSAEGRINLMKEYIGKKFIKLKVEYGWATL